MANSGSNSQSNEEFGEPDVQVDALMKFNEVFDNTFDTDARQLIDKQKLRRDFNASQRAARNPNRQNQLVATAEGPGCQGRPNVHPGNETRNTLIMLVATGIYFVQPGGQRTTSGYQKLRSTLQVETQRRKLLEQARAVLIQQIETSTGNITQLQEEINELQEQNNQLQENNAVLMKTGAESSKTISELEKQINDLKFEQGEHKERSETNSIEEKKKCVFPEVQSDIRIKEEQAN